MSLFEEIEGWLLEGQSVNLVGLSGSGRSRSLAELHQSLAAEGGFWSPHLWSAADVHQMGNKEISEELEQLMSSPGLPVLLVDDFGELITTTHGKRLEQKLFSLVNGGSVDEDRLRCVLVTAPRDSAIQVPGSALRNRCKVGFPPRRNHPDVEGRFGLSSSSVARKFCGGTHLLLPKSPSDANSERGIALQLGGPVSSKWVGELTPDHQRRLGDIVQRPVGEPSTWRSGQLDEALVPMVVEDEDGKCHKIDAMRTDRLCELVISERWPDQTPDGSIGRFLARCGNEPRPRWVDNFLSDLSVLRVELLAEFLSKVLVGLAGRRLQVLSRLPSRESGSSPREMAEALRSSGIKPEDEQRIEWRMYDKRSTQNLHDRQLLLPGRTEAFKLPPATVVIGQHRAGNESDAELPVRDHAAATAAWANARPIW